LTAHVEGLLFRFQDKALGDTVFRVGCDLRRKIGPEDRLVGPIKSAIACNMPYDAIFYALICACYFRVKGPKGKEFDKDIRFLKDYGGNLPLMLTEICGFDKVTNANLFSEARDINNYLITTY